MYNNYIIYNVYVMLEKLKDNYIIEYLKNYNILIIKCISYNNDSK